MGIGSFIKKSAKVATGITAGSLLGGAALGGLGGIYESREQRKAVESQNKANLKIAREQMSFQERMSSTAHQRETVDLEAAGLNRILSATGGSGASSPQGATAHMESTAKHGLTATRETAQLIANIANTKAQTSLLKNQAKTEIHRARDTQNAAEKKENDNRVPDLFDKGLEWMKKKIDGIPSAMGVINDDVLRKRQERALRAQQQKARNKKNRKAISTTVRSNRKKHQQRKRK